MNISKNKYLLDVHTHYLQVGQHTIMARSDMNNFIFDIYITNALNELTNETIEFISNSSFSLTEFSTPNSTSELVEKIIIPNIPNYLSTKGPYHGCMEELRENKYLKEFRKWIVNNNTCYQTGEINNINEYINRTIQETQESLFKRYLQENSNFTTFKSSSKTILTNSLGVISTPISIIDGIIGIVKNIKKTNEATSVRWQGFVLEARETVEYNLS